MSTQSLWGNLELGEVSRPPIILLKEQASALNKLTNGILVGEIHFVDHSRTDKLLEYVFDVRAPALNNYRFRLLELTHPIQLYPATVRNLLGSGSSSKCNDQAQLSEAIERILSSDSVHAIIKGLVAQSKALAAAA